MASKRVPIPIPINGLNTVNPDLPLEAGFARELTNYTIVNGRLRMRPAVREFRDADYSGISITPAVWYSINTNNTTSGVGSYMILNDGRVFQMSSNVVVTTLDAGVGISSSKAPFLVKHISYEGVIGVGRPRLAEYPFTAWTFTTIGITDTDITSACSYKGRFYVCDGTTIEYSGVGAITGAMAGSFPVSEFMDGQTVWRIFSFTMGTGNEIDNSFVIFGDQGKVLVYSGDFPNSSTWNLVANFDMAPLQSPTSVTEVNGDIWVSTTKYAYWLSDLLANGAQAALDNSPSAPIQNLWQNQGYNFPNNKFDTTYIPELDVIQCYWQVFDPAQVIAVYNNSLFPGNFSSARLVYHRKYKAWTLWISNYFDPPYRNYGLNFMYGMRTIATDTVQQFGRIEFEDSVSDIPYSVDTMNTDVDICTSWKTPYINAFAGNVQKVTNVRVFYQNSLNGYLFKTRVIFDYSDYNAPYGFYTQPSATAQINPGNYNDGSADLPTQSWDNYNPVINVAGYGGGVSLQISQQRKSGSADQQLNEVYSATVYLEDGGEMI